MQNPVGDNTKIFSAIYSFNGQKHFLMSQLKLAAHSWERIPNILWFCCCVGVIYYLSKQFSNSIHSHAIHNTILLVLLLRHFHQAYLLYVKFTYNYIVNLYINNEVKIIIIYEIKTLQPNLLVHQQKFNKLNKKWIYCCRTH